MTSVLLSGEGFNLKAEQLPSKREGLGLVPSHVNKSDSEGHMNAEGLEGCSTGRACISLQRSSWKQKEANGPLKMLLQSV